MLQICSYATNDHIVVAHHLHLSKPRKMNTKCACPVVLRIIILPLVLVFVFTSTIDIFHHFIYSICLVAIRIGNRTGPVCNVKINRSIVIVASLAMHN